ncbi:MAG: hypothetical protein ACREJ3_15620, partial [Polyangiaceae bacterium]
MILWAAASCLLLPVACDGNGDGVYVTLDGSSLGTYPTLDAGTRDGAGDDGAMGLGSDGAVAPGKGVGQACSAANACRAGLSCTSGICQPCGCAVGGAACTINDECSAGSFCGPTRTCTTGGTGALGASCTSDAACGQGLRCALVGLSAECQPEGTADVGGSCTTGTDCLGGLGCVATSSDGGGMTCEPNPLAIGGVSPLGLPTWAGETCADPAGPTQAYFRVPRGTGDGDFYRLPFPNNVRLTSGKIDLTGHPTPGSALLGYDLVQRWLSDLSATADGFSTYPTVLFRFSATIDQNGTLKGKNAIQWIDVTAPASPVELGFNWSTTSDRNAYICNNWIGIRPPMGQPLTPGHTYAVVFATSILDAKNQPIAVSPDLTALLSPTMPSDAALAAEWPKYQPLRDWATGSGTATSSILNATVFTVGTPNAIGPKLAAAVSAAAAPTAASWIRCGDAPSPCPQATGDR